jgi:hypothetical protein
VLEVRGRAQQLDDLLFGEEHRELFLPLRIVDLTDLPGPIEHLGVEELQSTDDLMDAGA